MKRGKTKMVDSHNYGMFVKTVGIIFRSNATEKYAMMTFLRKKQDGKFEKTSQKEGLFIKLGLDEIYQILEVLQGKRAEYKTVHSYKEKKTSISVKKTAAYKNKEGKTMPETIFVSANDYKFPLGKVQSIIFSKLLEHCFNEKIEKATAATTQKKDEPIEETVQQEEPPQEVNENEFWQDPTVDTTQANDDEYDQITEAEHNAKIQETAKDETPKEEDTSEPKKKTVAISATILGSTEKGLQIKYKGVDLWIPKSTVHSKYDESKKTIEQKIVIDEWIYNKNLKDKEPPSDNSNGSNEEPEPIDMPDDV